MYPERRQAHFCGDFQQIKIGALLILKRINVKPKTNIGRKLSSNSGASILFALFLFLVCAAIGSVVLTAGTAAAGRMSKTAEMDQRFYAVQSAAQLFKDQLDGQSVGIERTETTEDTVYTDSFKNAEGVAVEQPSTNYTSSSVTSYSVTWSKGGFVTMDQNTSNTLTSKVAINTICDRYDNQNAESAWKWDMPNSGISGPVPISETMEIQLSPTASALEDADIDLSGLPAVTVTYTAAADGSLTFIFSSGNYSVKLNMPAVVTDKTPAIRTSETSDTVYNGSGTQTDPVVIKTVYTTEESRTSVITWSFGSLEVIGK